MFCWIIYLFPLAASKFIIFQIVSEGVRDMAIKPSSSFDKTFDRVFGKHIVSQLCIFLEPCKLDIHLVNYVIHFVKFHLTEFIKNLSLLENCFWFWWPKFFSSKFPLFKWLWGASTSWWGSTFQCIILAYRLTFFFH